MLDIRARRDVRSVESVEMKVVRHLSKITVSLSIAIILMLLGTAVLVSTPLMNVHGVDTVPKVSPSVANLSAEWKFDEGAGQWVFHRMRNYQLFHL